MCRPAAVWWRTARRRASGRRACRKAAPCSAPPKRPSGLRQRLETRASSSPLPLAGEGYIEGLMILLIDNYDSFTFNLVHFLGDLGARCEVRRNDALTASEALAL